MPLATPLAQQGAAATPATAPAAEQATATTATAADAVLEARTSEVAAHLRCPVCQGLSIQDSPSELSQQMRSVVRDQLAAGRTPEEVKAYFVSKYGEWILLEPKAQGFNLVVYILPVLLVLAGLALITTVVRRAGASANPTSA